MAAVTSTMAAVSRARSVVVDDVGGHGVNQPAEGPHPDAGLDEARLHDLHVDGLVQLDDADGAEHAHLGDRRQRRCRRQPGAQARSMRAMSACQSPSHSSSMRSPATAQASGLPMKVGPCIRAPASPSQIPRATRSLRV